MKKINLAINGFGRIGRSTFMAILDRFPNLKVVAINDLTDPKTLAHLLKYDSYYGNYHKEVKAGKDFIVVANKKIPILSIKEPNKLPWKELGVDIVLECTGRFTDKEGLKLHLKAGAKKVILSAPAKSTGIRTVAPGVNHLKIKKSDHFISLASCTTNCLAPITELIRQNYGIKNAFATTIHAYTATQNLVDGPHKDLRRARAAAVNIIPTTTVAAIATTKIIPSLKGKFAGMAIRVPVPIGSLCDSVYLINKKTDSEAVNKMFIKAARGKYKGIVAASNEPLVSSDIIGDAHSAIVDLMSTRVIGGNMLKVVAWYDNEWGYSNRLAELSDYLRRFIK